MKQITQTHLLLIITLFLVLFDNYSFFSNTLTIYPFTLDNIYFLLSLIVVFISFLLLLLSLLSYKYTLKPLLIFILIISSLTSYFMNSYQVIIDESMIRNILQTNLKESFDLFSIQQILYLTLFGLIPSWFVYKTEIFYRGFKSEMLTKLKVISITFIIIIGNIALFSQFYTSFFREHKSLRYSTNPTYWIYSVGKYISISLKSQNRAITPMGRDAKIIDRANRDKKLIIMVVGEAVRADHLALNGYNKETTPLLKQEKIINLSNVYSCGTSTAHSVPCMFSLFGQDDFDYDKGVNSENILDIFTHTKDIEVLWRDNNSNSKGIANRVQYEDYKTSQKNTICNGGECRDEGMLIGLDKYIAQRKEKDIFIVLHQMGNHGPAYYKRYPKEFEKFTPVCKTNQLEQCSNYEISNAYDNAILYTDYFLSKTINFLKKYNKSYKTTMIYMSDHGESLGENGLYLHGLPYLIAPNAQKHVASLIWFGDTTRKALQIQKTQETKLYTHDNLVHTLLSLFEIKTTLYNQDLDMVNDFL